MHYGLVIVLGIGGVILLTFLCCALFMWLMNRRMAAIQSDLAEKHYEEVENMYQQMWGWRHGGIESLIGKGFDEEGILFSGESGRKSPLPGLCIRTLRLSCWMSPPLPWTRLRSMRYTPPLMRWCRAKRPSISATGFPPAVSATISWCLTRERRYSGGATGP